MSRPYRILLAAIPLLVLAYLLSWPVPIDPVAWDPPQDAGYTGDFAPNNRLDALRRLDLGRSTGPEDAALGPDGRVYASTHEGLIVSTDVEGAKIVLVARTGGRPLGIEFGADGRLYVADAYRGLVEIELDSREPSLSDRVHVLADRDEAGRPLEYVNDLDVAAGGTVYFSDASSRFGARDSGGTFEASVLDLMEHGGHGRVLRYDPETETTATLLDGLSFANGVALAADDSFLMIAETGEYRVLRLELSGPDAGRTEVVLENLPGFPDNVNPAADGTFWVGLVSPRSPAVDALAARPFLRRVVQRLPAFARPKPQRYGCVARFDADGRILETLQSPSGEYAMTTGAAPGPDGTLLVTSLTEPDLGLLR